MPKVRNIKLDELKGMAAVLVIIGHLIQYVICSNEGIWDNRLFCFIYSFHMPLFMFISGYLSYKSNGEYDLKWLVKRVKGLLIPFVIWSIIRNLFLGEIVSVKDLGKILIEVFYNPEKGYWFLLVLFEACVVLFLLEYALKSLSGTKKRIIKLIMFGIICVIFRFLISGYKGFGINLLGWHIFFYIGGNYMHELYDNSQKIRSIVSNKVLHIVVLLVFPVMGITWSNNLFIPNNALEKLFLLGYQYLVPMMGIAFCFVVVWFIKSVTISRILTFFGKYTMELYILQVLFIKPYFDNLILDLAINIVLCTVVSIFIIKVIEKFPTINMLLFGRRNKVVSK